MLRYAHTISSSSRRLASRHPMFCDSCTAGPRQFYPLRNNNFQYKELTNDFDLNNALGKYRTDSSIIITSLKNKPSEIRNSGEATIDWYPANERNTYGIQIMRWTYGNTHMIFTRNKIENTWAEWVQYVTKSDIPNLHYTISSSIINNPAEAIKEQWATMPDGYYLCEMRCGSAYIAIVQRIDDGQHGSVIINGYGSGYPIYLKCANGAWQ